MKHSVGVFLLLALGLPAVASAESFVISPEVWAGPRTGMQMLNLPALCNAMGVARANPGVKWIVHHAARDEEVVHAEELRSWLIALAVESNDIMLKNDLAPNEPIMIEIGKNP